MAQYPQRLGEADCRDFLRTGRCKYGESCKYHHPPNVQSGGGIKTPLNPSEPPFPIRPNEPPCQYFLKHGTCKFGQTCKFHHPPNLVGVGGSAAKQHGTASQWHGTAVVTNSGSDASQSSDLVMLLPQRPSEPDCIYFLRNGRCKYGATCKYHHPISVLGLSESMTVSGSGQHEHRLLGVRHMPRDRSYSTGSVLELEGATSSAIPVQFMTSQSPVLQSHGPYQSNGPTHIILSDRPIAFMVNNQPNLVATSIQTSSAGPAYSQQSQPTIPITTQSTHVSSPAISSISSSYETAPTFEQYTTNQRNSWNVSSSQMTNPNVNTLSPSPRPNVHPRYIMLRTDSLGEAQHADNLPALPSLHETAQPMNANIQHNTSMNDRVYSLSNNSTPNPIYATREAAVNERRKRNFSNNRGWSSCASFPHANADSSPAHIPAKQSPGYNTIYPETTRPDSSGQRERTSGIHPSASAPGNLSEHVVSDEQQDMDQQVSKKYPQSPSSFSGQSNSDKSQHWDDGLSKMTSALLNMLDDQDDLQEQFSSSGFNDFVPTTPQRSNQANYYQNQFPRTRSLSMSEHETPTRLPRLSTNRAGSPATPRVAFTDSAVPSNVPSRQWSPAWQDGTASQQIQHRTAMNPHNISSNIGMYLP